MNEAKQAGNKHEEVAAYDNLGLAYYSLGDYKKAIEFHQQSLSHRKRHRGKRFRRYSIYLGIAYYCLGDYKKAIEFHKQSLSIAKEIGEKDAER